MPTYRIEFPDLGDCVEFIDLVLRNRQTLQIDRDGIQVEIGRQDAAHPVFAVVLANAPEASGDRLLRLARCPGYQTDASWHSGERRTLNALLESVKLARQPQMPSGHPLAVLLFQASDDEFRRRYTELLDMACRQIRVGVVRATDENQQLTHVLFVGTPPAAFWPPAHWQAPEPGERSRAVACYRVRPAPDCRLYAQWDYEYPVRNIEQLYDFDHPRCHSLFALAGSGHESGLQPQWLRISEADYEGMFALPEQRLRLDAAAVAEAWPAVDLQPDVGHALELDFQVQREARGSSTSLEALETQIAHHQQAIVDLRRDYRVAQAVRRQAIYLAYVFEQPLQAADGGPPPLSPTLARFLDQPFSQLSHMRYGFYEVSSGNGARRGLHIVFNDRPETHAQLLTSLADEVYIQREQWRAWGLRLFVRRGDDVRPRLEDDESMRLVRELLWRGDHPSDRPVLLRAVPPAEVAAGKAPWEILYIRETMELTDPGCLQLLHDRFAQPLLEFRAEVPAELETQLRESEVRVSDQCADLERALVEAVDERIRKAEEAWHNVDERIREIARQTEDYDAAVNEAHEAMTGFPKSWVGFVETVLEADSDLHEGKVAAFRELRDAQARLAELQAKHADAVENVRLQIETDQEAVRRRRAAYETAERDVGQLLDQFAGHVQEFHARHRSVQRDLENRFRTAQDSNGALRGQLEEGRQRKRQLENELKACQKLHADIRREQRENETAATRLSSERSQCEEDRRRLEADRQLVQDQRRELETLRADAAELRRRYQEERTETEARRRQVESQQREVEVQIASLRADAERAAKRLRELQDERDRLERELAQLRQDQQRVQEGNDGIQTRLAAVADAKAQLQAKLAQLREEEQTLERRRGELAPTEQRVAQEREGLRTQEEQLHAEEQQLHAQEQELREHLALLQRRRAAMQQLLQAAQRLATDLKNAGAAEGTADSEVQVVGNTPESVLNEIRQRLL
jgi:hypothetical protein